ncbi:MAG TPA: hypothetical protein IAA05_03990 [Candidatus Blautia excrementipullorum]|nr:hypothetical protein [Candidatus Blautia excrementipullorum]
MAADIYIAGASLTPNPVNTGQQYLISVEIRDRYAVLADGDGSLIADGDGALIQVPEGVLVIADADNIPIADNDGAMIETD